MSICIISNQPFVPGKTFQLLFEKARSGFYALFRIHELIFFGILEGYGIQMKVVLRYEGILGPWDLGILLCSPLFSSSNCEVWEGERFRTQKKLREIRFPPRLPRRV